MVAQLLTRLPAAEHDMSWLLPAHDAEALPGRGVQCWLPSPGALKQPEQGKAGSQDKRVLIGNRTLLQEQGVAIPQCAPRHADAAESPAYQQVLLSDVGQTCCLLLCAATVTEPGNLQLSAAPACD